MHGTVGFKSSSFAIQFYHCLADFLHTGSLAQIQAMMSPELRRAAIECPCVLIEIPIPQPSPSNDSAVG